MKIRDSEDVNYILNRTGRVLTPNQRIVVMTYAAAKQRPDGTVVAKATDLAEIAGMSAPVFSRTRKELVELGWLERASKSLAVYRLTGEIEKGRDRPRRGHLHAVGG